MTKSFEEKILRLQKEIDGVQSELGTDVSSGFGGLQNWVLIVSILIPFIILLLLILVNPGFVQKETETGKKRSWGKILAWTILISIVFWAGLCFYWCKMRG